MDKAERLMQDRQRRAERKAAGLCISCMTPTENGLVYCNSCREKKMRYKHDTYNFFKSRELCALCGRVSVAGTGFVLCEKCRDIQRISREKRKNAKACL